MVYWVIEKQAANQSKGERAAKRIGPFQSRREAEQACAPQNSQTSQTTKREIVCDFA